MGTKNRMFLPNEKQISHKEENNMRREFLFISNEVTVDDYMVEATKWLRSMKCGEILADGRCLATELCEEEQKELSDYVYEIAYKEMLKSAGKHCQCKCDFGAYSEDFYGNFAVVLMKRLHTFNDTNCLKNKDKKYRFSTFLDDLSKDAVRMTFAQKRGVSEHVEQRIQNVRQAMRKVMSEKGLNISEVTPEMISAALTRYMSVEEVVDLLNISSNWVSIEQRNEEDGVEKDTTENAVYIDTKIFNVLEVDTEKLFDAFFSKLTDLEKFFVLRHVGCDTVYANMILKELQTDELVLAIVENDAKFSKQIGVETVIIERPGKCQKKGTETLVLEDVKCINDSLIRYQKANAKKILSTLKNGLKISDISGGCGVAYFMKQWEMLKEKYQK